MPQNRFTKLFAEADAAFNGKYKNELTQLMGMSKSEIDAIEPGTSDMQNYSVLIKVVEEASKKNLAQAELKKNIENLGDLAIKIAKKIPKLAELFI